MRQGNWNEQYSRKKNVKIYNMPENRGEKLPVSLINQLKEKLDNDTNNIIINLHNYILHVIMLIFILFSH
jgi:hypothetical protein